MAYQGLLKCVTLEGVRAHLVALWGGTAGLPYDPCHHAACDNLANLDLSALDLNADAVAAAALRFASSLAGVRPQVMADSQARAGLHATGRHPAQALK